MKKVPFMALLLAITAGLTFTPASKSSASTTPLESFQYAYAQLQASCKAGGRSRNAYYFSQVFRYCDSEVSTTKLEKIAREELQRKLPSTCVLEGNTYVFASETSEKAQKGKEKVKMGLVSWALVEDFYFGYPEGIYTQKCK